MSDQPELARLRADRPRPLLACYRLQLSPTFGFRDAIAQLDYLSVLGVSHLYLSPILAAAPGSVHGYDVVDHHRLNDELGGEGGFTELVQAAHARGLGIVLDVVPNHMAVHPANRQWWDVLRFGRASAYASWFDIMWEQGSDEVDDRLLLPTLPDHYGVALTDGTVVLDALQGLPVVRVGDTVLPMTVASTAEVLHEVASRIDDDAFSAEVEQLAVNDSLDPAASIRHLTILSSWPPTGAGASNALRDVVDEWSRDRDRLHGLLEQQHYRLAHWQTGAESLDYRRFFDVTGLIGLRVEDDAVFESTHSRLLHFVNEGDVDGLRVDHIDGLVDPTGYAEKLRGALGGAWLVVEKIIEPWETMPDEWPVDGSTGYETATLIDGLFVDSRNEQALTEVNAELTGEHDDWSEVRRAAKRAVAEHILPAELHTLAADLVDIATTRADRIDVAPATAEAVIRSYLVELPVYRTYARGAERANDRDAAIVEMVSSELHLRAEHDPAVVDLVAEVLVGPTTTEAGERFRQRFQQTSGPVMAKGVEDTAFYRYSRLVSLNEVGGDPARFGVDVGQFHERQIVAAEREPLRMVTTSTHDTKRSEDVRARISALSEVPRLWRAAATTWAMRDAEQCGEQRDPALELLLHQTFLGAAPISAERAHEYATKAMREAKRRTSWVAPDEAYEASVHSSIDRWLSDPEHLSEQRRLLQVILPAGRINAIGAKLLALTVPGVPDIYQGSELWTDSLVDPDNRRPVDFAARKAAALPESEALPHIDLLDDGRSKLAVVRAALAARHTRPEAFAPGTGTYEPLRASGPAADHVVAFVRGGAVATVVQRLPIGLDTSGGWRTTTLDLPPGVWRDGITRARHEGRVLMSDLFAINPFALLVRVP